MVAQAGFNAVVAVDWGFVSFSSVCFDKGIVHFIDFIVIVHAFVLA